MHVHIASVRTVLVEQVRSQRNPPSIPSSIQSDKCIANSYTYPPLLPISTTRLLPALYNRSANKEPHLRNQRNRSHVARHEAQDTPRRVHQPIHVEQENLF